MPNEGRLEIYYDDTWNAICDDRWDDIDATIACKQLGHKVGYSRPGGTFPSGTANITMDEVNCAGTETKLEDCPFNGWFSHDCNSTQHAGVLCHSMPSFI